jgi:hypothetical protein
VVALVAYLATAVGLPLPQSATIESSTPFPCQSHRCGCVSAEQCWRSCCCFSPAERLAWAKQHGVHVPEAVRLAMTRAACHEHEEHEHEAHEHEAHEHEAHEHHANHDGAHPACDAHIAQACCDREASQSAGCAHCPPGKAAAKRGRVVWVDGFQARKCQGLALVWIASGASLPLEIRPLWEFDWVEIDRIIARVDVFSPLDDEPPIRPPRV